MSNTSMARKVDTPHGEREFVFTDDDFEYIRQQVAEKTGIMLNDARRTGLQSTQPPPAAAGSGAFR